MNDGIHIFNCISYSVPVFQMPLNYRQTVIHNGLYRFNILIKDNDLVTDGAARSVDRSYTFATDQTSRMYQELGLAIGLRPKAGHAQDAGRGSELPETIPGSSTRGRGRLTGRRG